MIFCADPLARRQVDAHFAAEAAAARGLGGSVVIIDHDALLRGDTTAAVRGVPRGTRPAWYRGWMVPADRYTALSEALANRGTELMTGPADYRRTHELPGWYNNFSAVTPQSVWSEGIPDDVGALIAPLGDGPGIVKDYVKSRKHEWSDACYLPELTDLESVGRVVATFIDRQGEFLAGGVVVRSFEPFDDSGEARVWWLDGEPVLVGPHPDTPSQNPRPQLEALRPIVAAFGARFVTTDLARRTDGAWRVVEVGDGQVSDWPRTHDPALLVSALLAAVPSTDPAEPTPAHGADSDSNSPRLT